MARKEDEKGDEKGDGDGDGDEMSDNEFKKMQINYLKSSRFKKPRSNIKAHSLAAFQASLRETKKSE